MRAGRDGFKVGPVLASDIIKLSVIRVSPNTNIVDATETIAEKKIGALPVTEDHKLVGVLSETDVLQAFVEMTHKPSKLK